MGTQNGAEVFLESSDLSLVSIRGRQVAISYTVGLGKSALEWQRGPLQQAKRLLGGLTTTNNNT